MNENKFDKKYYEKYAMLSLEYCYNNSWKFFVLSDKPDLQNSCLNIGVEVTRAISNSEGEFDSIIVNKYFVKGLNREFVKNEIEQKIKKSKGEVSVIGDWVIVSKTKSLYDPKIHLDEIKKSIVSKTCKLNSNYKIYNKNHLYLFTGTSLVKNYDLKGRLADIKEATLSYKISFDLLFINCIDKIFVVDMAGDNITEILIDDVMLVKLKAEAAKN
jgi:hypothetical protein